ncbi:hypothetical protein [Nonomuraea aurantiaca]|uniref:hypothetical protein n=1 Tax=Nonomuraea aurantiaca TaxID=2878562 RepID=UPI001CD9BB4E|nr:hypothetical protein [Nonomuraea aurantiaca]MCA2225793.1 hypothetical protein [Nonomuraea aurantiaca]
MRLLVCATALSATALCAFAVPANAADTKIVYGYAWATGTTEIRVTPMAATYRKPLHTFKAVPGAKELRLDYAKAAFRRVTVACDLKETEGRVAIDRKGLGTTVCKPDALTDKLASGPAPVRVEYRGTEAVKINEVLAKWTEPRTARGTVKRVDDTTVLFTRAGRTVKLGYTNLMSFARTTRRCGDGWLAGRPVNADGHGLGKKACGSRDFTKALKSVGHPVLVQVDYVPDVNELSGVREVFGDA